MKKTLYTLGFIITLSSCNKKSDISITTPKVDTLAKSDDSMYKITPLATLCFKGATDKDSIFLSYEDNLGTVTGKLKYKHAEKDGNNGEIAGLMDGDTLKVTYTFISEGTTSDREIWFLKKGTSIIEAIGQYDTSGLLYANTKNITFTGTELEPTDCKSIDKQFISKLVPAKKVEKVEKPEATEKQEIAKKEDHKKEEKPISKKQEQPSKKKEEVKKSESSTKKTKENNTKISKEKTTTDKKNTSKNKPSETKK